MFVEGNISNYRDNFKIMVIVSGVTHSSLYFGSPIKKGVHKQKTFKNNDFFEAVKSRNFKIYMVVIFYM